MIVLQTKGAGGGGGASAVSGSSSATPGSVGQSASLTVNKLLVKQCTDLLVKHMKNLNQNQVIEQLEKFVLTTPVLQFYKVPHEEDPTTTNVFLSADDFYFEVSINVSGEILDVKFSMFSETPKSSATLKEIIWSWSWDSLSKHIDGIRSNYIINSTDHNMRSRAYKSIQHLEKDLHTLFQAQVKFLTKNLKTLAASSNKSLNHLLLDKLINLSPVGLFKRSELGDPTRLYFYSSPLDLISHFKPTSPQRSTSFQQLLATSLNSMAIDQLVQLGVGSYLCITLHSLTPVKTVAGGPEPVASAKYRLPSASSILLAESDEKSWHDLLSPYFNANASRPPTAAIFANKSNPNDTELPGTFLLTLSKPVVMCLSTLEELQSQLGVKTLHVDRNGGHKTPYFELLAKSLLNNQSLNDSYAVELPDEVHVYYITEQEQADCRGVLVDRLLFTHPHQIPIILHTLRKQQLFNELLLSCMRKPCSGAFSYYRHNSTTQPVEANTPPSRVRILEICLLEPFRLSIIVQHPWLSCYTVIEIDVQEGVIQTMFRDHPSLYDKTLVNEMLGRCHSIPVTIRALFMSLKQQQSRKQLPDSNNYNDTNGANGGSSSGPGQNGDRSHRNNRSSPTDSDDSSKMNQDFHDDGSMLVDEVTTHVTPRSLYACNDLNGNPITPNRLTPSRRDSYNPTGSASSQNHFNFSNFVPCAGSDAKKAAKDLRAELAKREGGSSSSGEESGKMKSQKSAETPNSSKLKGGSLKQLTKTSSASSPQPGQQVSANSSQLVSSNKKRKASDSSSRSASPSLTAPSGPTAQPPLAKRKMVSQPPNDLKRQTSATMDVDSSSNESTSSKNSSSAPNKKPKLKSSHSSADLSTGQSKLTNENKREKVPGVKSGANQNSSPSVLSAANKMNSSKEPGKLANKTSNKLDQPGLKKQLSTSSTPKSNPAAGMRVKPVTEDGMKMKICRDSAASISNKIQRSSSTSSSPANTVTSTSLSNKSNFLHNLSATEVQLKQPNSSNNSPLIANSSLGISTPSSGIQAVLAAKSDLQSQNSSGHHRTPSPSLSSMSSMSSWSSNQLTTPSPGQDEASSSETSVDQPPPAAAAKSAEPSVKGQKLKQRQAGETLLNKLTSMKSNTPPSATAFALGLGFGMNSFKTSNFKIPHKSKANSESSSSSTNETNDEDMASNSKTPLSASSPITVSKDKLNSPNKADPIKPASASKPNVRTTMPPPLIAPSSQAPINSNNNARNNMSPKWQATYSTSGAASSGSMSPRYSYNNEASNPSTTVGAGQAATSAASQAAGNKSSTSTPVVNPQKYPKSQPPSSSQPPRSNPNQSQTAGANRPLTPIPAQFTSAPPPLGTLNSPAPQHTNQNRSGNAYYFPNAKPSPQSAPSTLSALPLPPLMAPAFGGAKAIPPLMSFTPTAILTASREKELLMTPKSPSPPSTSPTGFDNPTKSNIEVIQIPTEPAISAKHLNANSVLSTASASDVNSGPPDSPTGETTTVFIPKLIPLERNPANEASKSEPSKPPVTKTIPTEPISTKTSLQMKAVDIASPDAPPQDEEDDDNLVIDLVPNAAVHSTSTLNIPTTPTEALSTSDDQSSKSHSKIPSPVQQLLSSSLHKTSSESSSALASSASTFTSTFTTRQLSEANSQNEILSPSATAPSTTCAPTPAVVARSPTQKPATKSPCIIEEDLINEAVTG